MSDAAGRQKTRLAAVKTGPEVIVALPPAAIELLQQADADLVVLLPLAVAVLNVTKARLDRLGVSVRTGRVSWFHCY